MINRDMVCQILLNWIFVFIMPFVSYGQVQYTAIVDAAFCGDIQNVQKLLNQGVSANSKTNFGETALMYSSLKGHIEIVKLLIENGADVNARSRDGSTALMDASWGGHVEVVKLLLIKGADPNISAMSSAGPVSALSHAKIKNNYDIVKILEKAGAR